jgi:2-polyprenyl-6-methoxyphenol hydroxylase-like FAD-dependent oxidoreductase
MRSPIIVHKDRLTNNEDEDGIITATFENGEKIKIKYVIGADGSRSIVRQLVNIGFADPDCASIDDKNVGQMVIADITSPPPSDTTRCIVSSLPDVDYFQRYLYKRQLQFLYAGNEEDKMTDKMLWSLRFQTHTAIMDK